MKRYILLLGIFYLNLSLCRSQTALSPDLVTDRPDQTEASALIPKGALQVETGFIIEPDRSESYDVTNYSYNTTLIKYGINEFLELRLITEYLGEKRQDKETDAITRLKGFSPIGLGIKTKLSEEKGFIPEAAFIGHINLNTNRGDFKPKYTAADFRFTLSHTLTKKLSFGYNLGAEWDGETADPDYIYTVTLGYGISDRVSCFVEGYGFLSESHEADQRFDCGMTFLIAPLVQWDISGGVGLTSVAPDAFASTGLSFRLFK